MWNERFPPSGLSELINVQAKPQLQVGGFVSVDGIGFYQLAQHLLSCRP